MGAEVEHRIGLPDLLQIGVVGSKSMVGACTTGVEQAHGVAFVAEGGLNADKDIAEVATEDQQILAIAVEIAGRLAPVLFKPLGVRGQAFVFLNAHPMGNGKLRRALHGIGVVDHRLQQITRRRRQALHVVALRLHLLHHPMDGTEDVEIGRRSDIALVGREAEHRDRQLLVDAGLDP